MGMIVVKWPSVRATHAQVWRVLDLSGMSQSPRQSGDMIKAGWVFLNGHRVASKKSLVEVNSTFTLEIRMPSGRVKTEVIQLTEQGHSPRTFARQTGPTTLNRRG